MSVLILRRSATAGGDGAVLASNTLTFTQTAGGLGASGPTVIKDMTLAGRTTGDDQSLVFDFQSEDGTGNRAQFKVDQANGVVSGWGAMKQTFTAAGDQNTGGNSFPQAGWNLSAYSGQALFVSYQIKIIRTSGPATIALAQMKNPRYGYSTGLLSTPSPTTCGNRLYGASGPKYYPDHYDGPVWQNEEPNWRSHSFSGSANFAELGTHVDWLDDQWHNHESFMQYNSTTSVANGKIRLWNDGQLRFTQDNAQPKDQSGDVIDFIVLHPGMTNNYNDGNGGTRTYAVYISKAYVASSQQRIMLLNASTYATATRRIPLSYSSWTDTQIVCSSVFHPTGFDYACVVNSSGTVVATYALS